MIETTDITLRESNGNYKVVCEIMNMKPWMIESKVFVDSGIICSSSLVHFWSDGKVNIVTTDHPIVFDAPNDDLREFSNWCSLNGWQTPSVDKELVENPMDFEFWLRLYRSGLIISDDLKKYDDEEVTRFKPER